MNDVLAVVLVVDWALAIFKRASTATRKRGANLGDDADSHFLGCFRAYIQTNRRMQRIVVQM